MSTTAVLDRLLADGDADAPGRRWLDQHGWPTQRDESWRYAPLGAIARAIRLEHEAAPAPDLALLVGDAGGDVVRIVTVDGRFDPELSVVPAGDGVLTIETGAPAEPWRGDEHADAFEALNHLAMPGATAVHVTGDAPLVRLVHVATAVGAPAHARTLITVDPGCRVTVVESSRAVPGAGLVTASTTIDAGAHSRIEHLRTVRAGVTVAQVVRTDVVAGAAATVRCGALLLGDGAVRHTLDVDAAGEGATFALGGLSIPTSDAHHDTAVVVRHGTSNVTSRQHFASIVADGARSSFTGHVVVAHGTVGTDAEQQHHSLLLGPTARADSRPWLEILSDDVACTHGATVGRLDDDGLFYLRSRGIPEHEARTILLTAFAARVVDELAEDAPARDRLAAEAAAAIAELLAEEGS